MGNLQRLFELVRKEDVVFWIGAGFSKYAGFPLGRELANIIYSNLNESEKKEIEENKNLQEITEDMVNFRNGSRNQLMAILHEVYKSNAISTEYHDILATIPHIKTFITTNYDTLIEDSIQGKYVKVVSDSDVPLVNEHSPSIIKIHGDLCNIETIVITSSDYREFYNKDIDTPLWHLLKERISTKTVLFLGYGLEDQNIIAIFEKINSKLHNNKKEIFFIAPNINAKKQNFLIRAGISYINLTGEVFICQLIENIDKNILNDIEKKYTSLNTANEYLCRKNVYANIKPGSKKNIIESLKPIEGTITHTMTFTINDKSLFHKIANNSSFNNIEINANEISDFKLEVNGLVHPITENLKKLILMPISQKTIGGFYTNNEDFPDIPIKIFKVKHKAKFELDLKVGKILMIIQFDKNPSNPTLLVTVQHNNRYYRPNEEILFYRLCNLLHSGKKIQFYNEKSINFSFSLNEKSDNLNTTPFDDILQYFQNLKIIERNYNFVFTEIGEVTNIDKHNVEFLIKNINGNLIDDYHEDKLIRIDFTKLKKSLRKKLVCENTLDLQDPEKRSCLLHGQNIEYGSLHIHIQDAIYCNKNDFISGKDDKFIIRGTANKYWIRYD